MSNPNPNEPLVRNPNTGPKETHDLDGKPVTDKPAGMSVNHTEDKKQVSDEEEIVGPDGDRG
jgi:hypothetical protein